MLHTDSFSQMASGVCLQGTDSFLPHGSLFRRLKLFGVGLCVTDDRRVQYTTEALTGLQTGQPMGLPKSAALYEDERSGWAEDNISDATKKIAARMMWYPVAYMVAVIPISICRFHAMRPGNPAMRMWYSFSAAVCFASSGTINVVLWYFTRGHLIAQAAPRIVFTTRPPSPCRPRYHYNRSTILRATTRKRRGGPIRLTSRILAEGCLLTCLSMGQERSTFRPLMTPMTELVSIVASRILV